MVFEKIVNVKPAYDKRNPNPAKNFGIGACKIRFILKGPKGAVQFQIGTDWYLPHVQKELEGRVRSLNGVNPEGLDVGYHAYEPQYDGQISMGCCEVLDGKECYYDGSGLWADELVPKFIAGGTEWLWKELEKIYMDRFGKQEAA